LTLEDYERSGFGAYEKLAATVSTILATALRKHPEIRLQQLQHRSKAPTSLRKKLVDRGIVDPPDLAETVKDLAGCRTIFYTNADARAFEQSGIIQENFEIDWARTKRHHPLSAEQAPFISINLVICLKDDRTPCLSMQSCRASGASCRSRRP
jgi:ppGpp synthetase/RelA/SpoT-type nucleotidyltranferase